MDSHDYQNTNQVESPGKYQELQFGMEWYRRLP